MRTFEEYRALIGGKGNKQVSGYKYKPKTKEELIDAIENEIGGQGTKADLNCINTSLVTDMSELFDPSEHEYANGFNGDISRWDTSNVNNFYNMFAHNEKFDGDLSTWDVSRGTIFNGMFMNAIKFNSDISSWNVTNAKDMGWMFCDCTSFNQDLSSWDVRKVINSEDIFDNCPIDDANKPKFN